MPHIPVLLHEVIRVLDPQPGEFFIDGTFGEGGYTKEILAGVGPQGKVLAIDWDEGAISRGESLRAKHPNLTLRIGNFADIPSMLEAEGLPSADGIVLDLGFSSAQLAGSGRGFSFSKEASVEPLRMTYSTDAVSVRDILRSVDEDELRSIIRKLGEERFAGRIARMIKTESRKKPIETAGELADVVRRAVPHGYERGRIDPSTRTFQALRIYANQELENLERFLTELPAVLHPGGRAAVVSFHSLEDRIVKNHFKSLITEGLMERITKKPTTASPEEMVANPRSRSAKLRAGKLL